MTASANKGIPYFRSNSFMRSWSQRTCEVLQAEGFSGPSMDRPPPVLSDRAASLGRQENVREKPSRKKKSEDPYLNVIHAGMKVAKAASSFSAWIRAPAPDDSKAKASSNPVIAVPSFDIQDLPGAMRKLDMPVSARLLERWFAGQLNYSRNVHDQKNEIDQNGAIYPGSMIDTTSVKMSWVLSFERARKVFEQLVGERIRNQGAQDEIRKLLIQYRNRKDILAWNESGSDIRQFHKRFQFQRASVEASWGQKFQQFLTQSVRNEGVPDDLTGSIGSFNIFAAVRYAYFDHQRRTVVVTDISVYVRDGFTFIDDAGATSQYLGHWNRSHVAVVPAHQLAAMANIDGVDYAVTEKNSRAQDSVLHPVRNKDFRDWQAKHARGGDFVIYTDRVNIKLNPPVTVSL
jgi:hypothetical protein